MKSFVFIGGDMRIIYAAEKLGERYDCRTYGFSSISGNSIVEPCDFAVLPLPASVDGENINAPLNNGEKIGFDILRTMVKPGGTVLSSKSFPLLREICDEMNLSLINYFEREELAIMNAVPTAEGALEIAIRELPVTVNGTNVLITGFGRIALVLARYFSALGARVYVAARRVSDLAKIRLSGYIPVSFGDETGFREALSEARIIMNTVPSVIFDKPRTGCIGKNSLFMELASVMSLEDTELAEALGIKVIWARSLPGKTAPVTSGYIIADTIANIVMERSVSH